ncbi:MAG: rhodanese-like domain-containing protein [Pseudomonadota bacterium]|nr:rhodanese-like domain-containing protein [Pseudomonadota bacterium]
MITENAQDAIAAANEAGTLFVDTRSPELWAQSTIPGAVCLNVYSYFIPESSEDGIRGMVAGARAAFAALGVDKATKVVFFEDQTGMVSPRALWFHQLCDLSGGVILDGGWQAWCAAGGETAPGVGEPATIEHGDPAQAGTFRRDLVASTDEVLARGRVRILDARRPAEWEGSYVHACCGRAGRIEGAQLLYFEDLIEGGQYKSPEAIRAIAEAAGFKPEDEIISYCHRGARAATANYGLALAGYTKLKVYTGSWHEWAGDPSLPIVEGTGEYVHR